VETAEEPSTVAIPSDVVFSDDVMFDEDVFGRPHTRASVILTDFSFDEGLSGSHIAALYSGINGVDVVSFPWS